MTNPESFARPMFENDGNLVLETKKKFLVKAVSFKDLENLAKEIDELANDPSKNEKIGLIFRTIEQEGDEDIVIDTSQELERKEGGALLDSTSLMEWSNQYRDYVKETFPDNFDTLSLETIVYYYALDKTNKKENISVEDKHILYIYNKVNASPEDLIKKVTVFIEVSNPSHPSNKK